jgi:alcohol dehydrogenase (cytochrome c)
VTAPDHSAPDGASDDVAAEPPRRRRRRRWPWALGALVALVVAAAVAPAFVGPKGLRWRVRLFWERAAGQYPEIPFKTFVRWLRPDSPIDLSPLVENRNLSVALVNEFDDDRDADAGAKVFATACARCHGDNARGGFAPSLVDALGRNTDWTFFATVKWGRPKTPMLPAALTDREIWYTETYVRRLVRLSEAAAKGKGPPRAAADVTAARLLAAEDGGDDWLTYGGGYTGHRHSTLGELTKANVGALALTWTAQFRSNDESVPSSPIVVDGTLFVSTSFGKVVALDARTGGTLWEVGRAAPSGAQLEDATGNRGVAVLGTRVFIATLDAHLVAIDAQTGHKLWDVVVPDRKGVYVMSAAPLAVRDRIIVGVGGGDYGSRGFVAAFAAADGRRLWTFDTVPGPGQPGHETWPGDTWTRGGAGTWTTGAYDKDLDLVYWGTGNPAPVYDHDVRKGTNLYSACALALEAETGKLRWHFQFTPSDDHDYDSTQQPIVADVERDGARVPALLWANRNAFFYGLDRRTGKFLFGQQFAKQTWAKGLDESGHPIVDGAAEPSAKGTVVWPWVGGATNWRPPSYDPGRGLVFVPTTEAASIYFSDVTKYEEGVIYRGGASRAADLPGETSMKAIDARTGVVRWTTRLERGLDIFPSVGGALSTKSGLVFHGYRNDLEALDADTGKPLWRVTLGGPITAAPIAFAVDGHERVAVMAGRSLFVFGLPQAPSSTP